MVRIAVGPRGRGVVGLGWTTALVALLALLSISPAEARRKSHGGGYAPPTSAMVLDPTSGRILYAQDIDGPRHPASLTKVMTLFLLFEQLDKGAMTLDTPLQVSAAAMNQAPSRLGVKKGETIRVEDAIKAIVTRSANDVAVVIAENIAGSEKAFAERMNEKALELGMRNTHFENASGLPNKAQITTARDLATLGKAVRERFPNLFAYFATRSFEYAGAKVPSHNRLMNRLEGMDGIKTGFTNASGFNLLASVRRGDKSVIAVVMGGITQKSRDDHMAELVNRTIDQAEAAPALVASAAKAPAPAGASLPAPAATPIETASASAAAMSPAAVAPRAAAAVPALSDPLTTGSIAPALSAATSRGPGQAITFALSFLGLAGVFAAIGLTLQRRSLAFVLSDAAAVAIVSRDLLGLATQRLAERLRVARLRARSRRQPAAEAGARRVHFESSEPYLSNDGDRRLADAYAQRGVPCPPRLADTAGPWIPPDQMPGAR
ncbi:D-alanyl-D-alanine carboxypeptidase family protein [Alsobacter soli]|uniref:D-alanyl-D-alanine carboxypeptidase family protein n=1 Tax=Alsobacter soli TaxID=2109933 RepID=UPI001FE1CAB9|nr:D-alanyl-D-alanine carboxypeptidase family protein [Alsobacter soli]